MKIAYIKGSVRGDTDLLLAELAARLAADGVRLFGVVQINTDCGKGRNACDMDVRVVPTGSVHRISQSLGPGARGCRLDPSALEAAVAEVSAQLDETTGLLILNKFGKHEADGRGFRGPIAEALSRDIPVILAVNNLNLLAFHDFTEGLAVELPARVDALSEWYASVAAEAAVVV